MTTIYVVRHGQSRANAGEYTDAKSVRESVLSDLGIEQANKLAKKLSNIHFDAIFSSDLARAKQTADIVALERNIEVKTSELIRERSYHEHRLNSKVSQNEKEFQEAYRKALENLDDKAKMQFKLEPDVESAEEGALRLLTFIREIAVGYSEKTVMVVCHGNIMRSLLTHLGFAKYDSLPNGAIENTGYFILESDGIDFHVKEIEGVNIQEGVFRGF